MVLPGRGAECDRARAVTAARQGMMAAVTGQIRRAAGRDIATISESLARAFEDDPVMAWVFPEVASRRSRLARFFAVAAATMLPRGEIWTSGGGESAAIWAPPGRWRAPLLEGVRMAPIVGARAPLLLRGFRNVERNHPRWPHWYLSVLGTDPPAQGRGLGSAVMEPVLSRCDEQGLGAYLESSKESNVPYYRHHGFEVVDVATLLRGPRLWLMWRHPRS